MRYLVDSCVLICVIDNNIPKLGELYNLLRNPKAECYVSVASYWEIIIKKNLGKLEIPSSFAEEIMDFGFKWLPLEPAHIDTLELLPDIHKDPFDRILIAQARYSFLKLLTLDKKIQQYF
jgi:PIN domain nuclease of toxin-antitoxin system